MHLLSGLYGTADSIKLIFSVTIAIFFPAIKFGLFLPLSKIYFDIHVLPHILSSINSYKFTPEYLLNGPVQRSFPEN
jgi:hypothetical protein